ncbi:MAG TPA: cbb3-type cytochrome c oxidase subunit I [Woeseiaceae bacterium]|nr:cbb3-type cytochrome c oxidase subunit I [Woeseiaceae bacterium]
MESITSNFVYDLPLEHPSARSTTRAWLSLSLASLIAAGIFALLLVLARTPFVQEHIPLLDFFHVALVIHVTLSALIWLLSFSAVIWSLGVRDVQPLWDRISFLLAASGTAVIAAAPFLGANQPEMNNYVPVLAHPVFYAGLALFGAGILSYLVRVLYGRQPIGHTVDGVTAMRAGSSLSALITGVAIIAVIASMTDLPATMAGTVYFEFLFWGGGHVIQFSYTLLMMIAWVLLADRSGCRLELSPRLTLVFLIFLALPVITVPFLYLAHDVASAGHRLAFTELMKYGGLSCLPLGLAVAASFLNAARPVGEQRYLRSALFSSIVLFLAGGILGFMIVGLDIVIPAHYHGATVGVSIAFMGLSYYLLPRLGYGPLPPRLTFWQPLLYGGGQLLHITGLAWTGGYGVQRKTAGAAQALDRTGEVLGMGLMGIGGLISVIGGVLFLVIAWRSMWARR